jgi:hypothetical protein
MVEKRMTQRYLTTTVVQSPLPSRPTLISLELTSGRPHTTVTRVRFGTTPPRPLTDMQVGELDLTRATILRPVTTGALPSDPTTSIANMAGSTTVRAGRMGIYWESYGISSGDTVDITVSVTRPHERTAAEKLGALVGRGGPATDGITIAWREPSSTHSVTTIPGRIPIQGRVLNLDLSQVDPGYWTITVKMARPGKPGVSKDHEFRIIPP